MVETKSITEERIKEIIEEALKANNKILLDEITPYLANSTVIYNKTMKNVNTEATSDDEELDEEDVSYVSNDEPVKKESPVKIKITSRKRKSSIKSENDNVESKELYCADCDTTFVKGDGSWTSHLKTFGCKPHKCSYCDKGFIKRYTRKIHETEVHSTDVIKCDFPNCISVFNSTSKLSTHQKKVHGTGSPNGEPSAKRTRVHFDDDDDNENKTLNLSK